jgi:hypothetical protein
MPPKEELVKASGNNIQNTNMSRDANSICEGIVALTLLYGSEVWATSAENRKWMRIREIKCMRAMCGVSIALNGQSA